MKYFPCVLVALGVTASVYGYPFDESSNNDARIIGGSVTNPSGYNFMVSLWFDGQFYCGGSIISKRFAVTAAQCITPNSAPSYIIAGAYKLTTGGKRYDIVSRVVHENYNPSTGQNDIGLVKTNTIIEFTDQIQRIPLADDTSLPGTFLSVCGWGITSDPGTNPINLRFLRTKIISNADCNDIWPNNIYSTNFCTFTKKGEGICDDDTGGPLVRDGKLEGIVSWGSNPCADGKPDVHTRVSRYINWIKDAIAET